MIYHVLHSLTCQEFNGRQTRSFAGSPSNQAQFSCCLEVTVMSWHIVSEVKGVEHHSSTASRPHPVALGHLQLEALSSRLPAAACAELPQELVCLIVHFLSFPCVCYRFSS